MKTIQDLLTRLRAEYLEMPGLRLTSEQVERLCGIERTLCRLVLDLLVKDKFLVVNSNGRYARVSEGAEQPDLRTAKANLRMVLHTQKAS